jgi:two-component system nitrogen regulation response regulator GlnG
MVSLGVRPGQEMFPESWHTYTGRIYLEAESIMPELLVIDDDPLTLECFQYLFPKGQVSVRTAESASEGLAMFRKHTSDVLVLDIRLPDLSGLEAFQRFHEIDARVPIILMTGHGRAETAIDAMRLGAYEYVLKPLDPASLREIITRAIDISKLMRVPATMAEADSPNDSSDILIGRCGAMQEVYKAIGRVASQDVTVLILGESGTGKELVARAIYHYSKRSHGRFLAINCAAIPENLLESELFGHEKGAFTGADRRRIGKFEQCNGGTLFLDEIGDMTPLTQTKILRVLQDQCFEPVGGNESIRTDVRVIAATNGNLQELIAAGLFRNDLYFRLNIYTIKLPPLRERDGDLPLLVDHFVRRISRELGKSVRIVARETQEILDRYAWPGNVRELQSVLKQAILQATGPVLVPEFLPEYLRGTSSAIPLPSTAGRTEFPDLLRFVQTRLAETPTELHADFQAATERVLFLEVLGHVANNFTQAARILGISRATLRNKLNLLGISVERLASLEEETGEM